MKKPFLFILFFVIGSSVITAQRPMSPVFEVLVGGGPNLIFGDIGEGGIGPAGFIGARYFASDNIIARINLDYATGNDSDEETKNFSRKYRYETTLIEGTAQLDYYFYFSEFSGRKDLKGRILNVPRLGMYAFVGVGAVYYDPNPEAENQDHTDYSKISPVFPHGLGIQYRFTRKLALNFEVGRRFTTSDYLDGFSPESSESKDMYYFTMISVNYRFKPFSGNK